MNVTYHPLFAASALSSHPTTYSILFVVGIIAAVANGYNGYFEFREKSFLGGLFFVLSGLLLVGVAMIRSLMLTPGSLYSS
jgi:hypothetical protein